MRFEISAYDSYKHDIKVVTLDQLESPILNMNSWFLSLGGESTDGDHERHRQLPQ